MMTPTMTTIGGSMVAVGLVSLLGLVFWHDYNLLLSHGFDGLPWWHSARLHLAASSDERGDAQYNTIM